MVVVQCCTARHPYVDFLLSFYLSMITASMLAVRCRQFTRGSEVIGPFKGKQSAQEQETENDTSLFRHHPALCDTSTTRTYPGLGPDGVQSDILWVGVLDTLTGDYKVMRPQVSTAPQGPKCTRRLPRALPWCHWQMNKKRTDSARRITREWQITAHGKHCGYLQRHST